MWRAVLCLHWTDTALRDLLKTSDDMDIAKFHKIKSETLQCVEFPAKYMREISTF